MVKKYILIFFYFFSVFTLIGVYKGWQWRNHSEYLNNTILQNVNLRIEQEHYYLLYTCGDHIYQYDIDSDKLQRKLGLDALKILATTGPASRIPIDEKLVLGLLGGSTAGYSLPKIINRLQGKQKKSAQEIITAVAGAISGYSFGYWLTSRIEPECYSKEIATLLNQKSNWISLKQKIWIAKYTSVSLILYRLKGELNDKFLNSEDIERFNKLKLPFDEVSKRAEEIDYDFKSSDFIVLDDMKSFLEPVLKKVSSQQN